MNDLTLEGMFKDGFALGLKNLVAIIVNVILWGLTIWIPYLNVGTTIGLFTLIAKMGRDEGLSFTEIFNPEYRKYMGEFFLVIGFMIMGITAGYLFLIIPGIVIAIAWGQATLLVLDKGFDPIAAIKKSNEITYGKKWIIFLGPLLVMIVSVIVLGIVSSIGSKIHPTIGGLLGLAGVILVIPFYMGINAYIYRELTSGI